MLLSLSRQQVGPPTRTQHLQREEVEGQTKQAEDDEKDLRVVEPWPETKKDMIYVEANVLNMLHRFEHSTIEGRCPNHPAWNPALLSPACTLPQVRLRMYGS